MNALLQLSQDSVGGTHVQNSPQQVQPSGLFGSTPKKPAAKVLLSDSSDSEKEGKAFVSFQIQSEFWVLVEKNFTHQLSWVPEIFSGALMESTFWMVFGSG